MAYNLLKGKRGIITGALDENSIAWKVAEKAYEEGATFVLTNAPIAMRMGEINKLAEQTGSAKVAWIGQTVARELFGDQDPVDQVIRVRGVPFTIVGVLERKGQNASGQDQDDIVVMPMSTFRNRIWNAGGNVRRIWTIFVKVREGQDMKAVEQSVRDLLRQRLRVSEEGDDTFSVNNLSEVLQAQEEASRVMTWLLSAVAGVSLIVGGIGIMNIMLVSVTERTREIGVRLAIGALEREVLLQFLIEAVVLAALGGLIGIVLATGASIALAQLMQIPYAFDASINLLAFGFSAAIGVVFGYFPARRAARLDPIDALRHE